jgi:hypothetical protein
VHANSQSDSTFQKPESLKGFKYLSAYTKKPIPLNQNGEIILDRPSLSIKPVIEIKDEIILSPDVSEPALFIQPTLPSGGSEIVDRSNEIPLDWLDKVFFFILETYLFALPI